MAYIDDIDEGQPLNTEPVSEGAVQIRDFKTDVKGSFPNLGQAAVTKTAAEINDLFTITDAGALAYLDTVGTAQIDADAVTATQIAPDAVGSSEIAANAVGASEIADNAVVRATIGNDAVGVNEIAVNAVNDAALATASVAGSKALSDFENYALPVGWYMISTPATVLHVMINTGAGWVALSEDGCTCWSDGTNTRLSSGSSPGTAHWLKFS